MTDDIVEADEGKSQVVISCIDSKTQYRSLCQNKRIVFEPEFCEKLRPGGLDSYAVVMLIYMYIIYWL